MVHTHTTEWNYLYGTLNDYMTQNSVTLATLKVSISPTFYMQLFNVKVFCTQLFSIFSLALLFFGKRILPQKLCIKC